MPDEARHSGLGYYGAMDEMEFDTTPLQIRNRIEAGERLSLIDVREPEEFQLARIEGAELIPVATVPAHLRQIRTFADDMTIVVFCHHGIRSRQVVEWLRNQGITACQNMAGGIDRWSQEVDRSVPRY